MNCHNCLKQIINKRTAVRAFTPVVDSEKISDGRKHCFCSHHCFIQHQLPVIRYEFKSERKKYIGEVRARKPANQKRKQSPSKLFGIENQVPRMRKRFVKRPIRPASLCESSEVSVVLSQMQGDRISD